MLLGLDRTLATASRLVTASRRSIHEDYLSTTHRQQMFGGWRHEDGRWITQPHYGWIKSSEAVKALFCPICRQCKRLHTLCACPEGKADICWAHIGQTPKDEDVKYPCPLGHGQIPWRVAMVYSTVFLSPGNQHGKTTWLVSEMIAAMIGRRPWDDTLTLRSGAGRSFVILCQTLKNSGAATIAPIVERMASKYIRKQIKSTSGQLDGWIINSDALRLISQDQHSGSRTEASPLEGLVIAQAGWDEPMKGEMRSAITRGLVRAKSGGGGRELIAATPLKSAYLFDLYQSAWNKGGHQREVRVIEGSIHDNPSLTQEAKRQTIASWPIWEREAREYGVFTAISGRLLPDFDPDIHCYDAQQRQRVYMEDDGETPNSCPVIISVDPHDVRPWVFAVGVIDEENEWFITDEWPRGDYQKMRHHRDAGISGTYDDYCRVIDGLIEKIPGGRSRVQFWCMDPAAGNSQKAGSGKTIHEEMGDRGYFFTLDAERDEEVGHAALRSKIAGSWRPGDPVTPMCHPHFWVYEECQNTIWSLLNYVNRKHKDPEKFREQADQLGKDQVDVIRYPLTCPDISYMPWRNAQRAINVRIAQRAAAHKRSRGW